MANTGHIKYRNQTPSAIHLNRVQKANSNVNKFLLSLRDTRAPVWAADSEWTCRPAMGFGNGRCTKYFIVPIRLVQCFVHGSYCSEENKVQFKISSASEPILNSRKPLKSVYTADFWKHVSEHYPHHGKEASYVTCWLPGAEHMHSLPRAKLQNSELPSRSLHAATLQVHDSINSCRN